MATNDTDYYRPHFRRYVTLFTPNHSHLSSLFHRGPADSTTLLSPYYVHPCRRSTGIRNTTAGESPARAAIAPGNSPTTTAGVNSALNATTAIHPTAHSTIAKPAGRSIPTRSSSTPPNWRCQLMESTPHDESQRSNVDPTVWGDLTSFKRDLLRTLAALDAPNGLAIKAELNAHYPNLTHARVYQNLDQLADEGLITKRSVTDRENAYSLTDHGEAHLQAAAHRLTDALQGGEGS